ncbi:MAG: DUF3987 domain-containing protein [Prevotella sp.]|nr:DUF3987 domain-containing protein [Prevotella sp.]
MEMILERLIALNARQTKEQTRAFVKECPLQDYDKLTQSPRLKQMAERINSTDDDEKQRKLKSWLPFRCPHYTQFRDDYRDREHIVAESFTWQTCIDIDDPELVEKANEMSERLNMEIGGRWQGLMLHKDYSIRRKLHIDIRLPLGMTVPEAQREYCKALGVECDTSCFTPERFIYISPADFEIYRADGWYQQLSEEEVAARRKAYTDRGLSIDGRTEDGSYYDPGDDGDAPTPAPVAPAVTPDAPAEKVETKFPQEFKGVPYTSIICEYWLRTGGEPSEGERNKRLHQLAANLRAICDNSEEWLLEVMPNFKLSVQEMKSIIHSACKEPTKGSRLIDQIVNALEMGISSEEIEDAEAVQAETGVKVNVKALPIGLKESLIGVPVSMHMPVLCGVLPIAAAYADQVQILYCDGNLQHLGLMSIIRGEQASNKSVVKNAVDVWKRQFDEEDALARKREEEWKERKKGRKANEKAPEDPKVLIRMVPVTVSCSTLLKRFKNANGHCIYSFGEELDTLRKTNGAGSWSSKYDIYRLSFDQGEWGQDYNSDQAESGVVKVAYNWTMLGTNGAMRKCFKSDNIENGLSSRILVAEMPDSSFSKMPKFGRRSAEDEAKIQEAVTRLRSFSGLVDTPRLRRAIEGWVEAKRVEAAKDIDHVKDTYRKRAAVIGFRCGVIFHLLSGKDKETKACLDFALMMAEYCLSQQMKAFGEALRNEYISAQDECQRYGANHSVFDQLAPTFSRDDLRALKSGTTESGLRNIVMRWKRDGWIVPIDRHHWQKVATE